MDKITEDNPVLTLNPGKPKHRMVARLLSYGMTPPTIAQHLNITQATAERWAMDPRTKQAMETLRELKRVHTLARRDEFDALLDSSVTLCKRILDAPDNSKRVSMDLKFRVAQTVMDRHPDGEFVKTSKQQVEDSRHITNETLEELRLRAMQIEAEVIDIPNPRTTSAPEVVSPPASDSHEGSPSPTRPSGSEAPENVQS